MKHPIATLAVCVIALAPALRAQAPAEARLEALAEIGSPGADEIPGRVPALPEWNERNAEHLLNRAGFGARTPDVQAAVAQGLAATVERLLTERTDREPYFVERYGPDYRRMRDMSDAEREEVKREVKRQEQQQMEDYRTWWFERLLSGEEALRERMTLFWHGFFTSSPAGVRRTYELLKQNQFLRENALGSYADLLRGIVRDPAMLMYLDNHVNRRGNPNENFARELMELFSLGEGNYTEQDVKEAARALTGRASDGTGQYVLRRQYQDRGVKTILGVTGKLDGEALVEILLDQEACPRWVAGRMLAYLEGVEPEPERLAEYAAFLRANDYAITPFLRKLFLDPRFYDERVVGARIASPVDYLVGSARRLGIEPPGILLHASAAALGQRLLHPPSVKGWDEGMAWITTASLMQRGNFAGMMLGVVDADDVLSEDDWQGAEMGGEMGGEMGEPTDGQMGGEADEMSSPRSPGPPSGERAQRRTPLELRAWQRARGTWRSSLNLGARLERRGAQSDEEIVDALLEELLAVETTPESRSRMIDYLAHGRRALGVVDGRLLAAGAEAEHLLRRLAHLVLSLPEAQLT